MTILIKDGILVTVDSQFRIFNPGSVLIEKNRIIDLGYTEDVIARNAAPATIVEAKGKIIAPGLVSSHNHLGYTVFRGMAEDIGAKPTPSLFLPMKHIIKKRHRPIFAALGTAELLRGGVTTVLEMEEDADIIAPILQQTGLRAGIAIMTNDVNIGQLLQGQTVFDEVLRTQQINQSIELIEKWHQQADGRLTAFVAANMALSCSKELLASLRKIADQFGVGATYHVGLGAYEVELVQKLYGCRPIAFAKNMGFLNSDCIVAHCHYMNEEDLNVLKISGATVAHCPVLNSLRGAAAPIREMLELGIPISLGLDNYYADYFDVMRACIAVARVRSKDATFLSARKALRFATIDAAKAMGLDHEIGSLEIGKKADIILLNTQALGVAPITDPVSSMVYHASANHIDSVWVDGKILVEKGKLLTMCEEEILDTAQQASDEIWKSFSEKFPEHYRQIIHNQSEHFETDARLDSNKLLLTQ